jgi:chromosome segregation ATPase
MASSSSLTANPITQGLAIWPRESASAYMIRLEREQANLKAKILSDTLAVLKLQVQIKADNYRLNQLQPSVDYWKSLETQLIQLIAALESMNTVFEGQRDNTKTHPVSEIPPALATLDSVSKKVKQMLDWLYHSEIKTIPCALRMEEAYLALVLSSQTQGKSDPDFTPPSQTLIQKFKTATDAGIMAMQQLANTFLELIPLLQLLHQLKKTTRYLHQSISKEIAQLQYFLTRVQTQLKLALEAVGTINRDLLKLNGQLNVLSANLEILKMQLEYVNAEIAAANNSGYEAGTR